MPRVTIQNPTNSLVFNGTSTAVELSSSYGATFANAYSIEFWFKAIPNGNTGVFFCNGDSGSANTVFRVYIFTNKLAITLKNDAGTNLINSNTSKNYIDESWHHLVWVDNFGTTVMYIDGVADGTNFSYTPSGTLTFNQTSVGVERTSTTFDYLQGTMYGVNTYNVALTAQQVNLRRSGVYGSLSPTLIWNLNEGTGTVAHDTSGNGNNGNIVAGLWSTDVASQARTSTNTRVTQQNTNCSLTFNGTSNYVTTSLVPSSTAFGFMGWAKASNNSAGAIVGASTNTANGFVLYYVNGHLRWQVYYTSSNSGVSIGTNTASEWTHIAACYDTTSNNLVMWVNGIMQAPTPIAGTYASTTATIAFGNFVGATWFNGSLSNWSYIPAALTTQQVLANMQSGIVPSNAVENWQFNEGTGNTVYGKIGGNNGTIQSSGVYTADAPYKTRSLVNGNLVYNGGFEFAPPTNVATTGSGVWINGTSAGSYTNGLFGWYASSLANGMTAYFDNTQSHSGNYSLHIAPNGNSTASCQIIQDSTLAPNILGYVVPTSGGVVMNYSFWMKTTVNSGSATGGAQMFFIERTGAGSANGGPTTTNVITTTGWTQYTASWTTSAGTSYITPKILYNNTGGAATLNMDVWIDDVVVVPGITPTRSLAV